MGLGDPAAVYHHACAAFQAGIHWFQIREKTIEGRTLFELTRRIVDARPPGRRVYVNARADIALAAHADGVHLPADALPPAAVTTLSPKLSIGISCHNRAEVQAAQVAGVDYANLSPVFDTPSKRKFGPPQGVEALREVCAAASIPILALGGITLDNARHCLGAGAHGIAAIRLFQPDDQLPHRIAQLQEPLA